MIDQQAADEARQALAPMLRAVRATMHAAADAPARIAAQREKQRVLALIAQSRKGEQA